MNGQTKTILTLGAYFVVSEAMYVLSAISGQSTWGTPISMGLVVGLFSVLAYKKKTWARHLILVLLGFGTFFSFSATLNSPSVLSYLILAIYASLFWALCWHKPILEFLGVIPSSKAPESDPSQVQSPGRSSD
jgi:hypothetical protein